MANIANPDEVLVSVLRSGSDYKYILNGKESEEILPNTKESIEEYNDIYKSCYDFYISFIEEDEDDQEDDLDIALNYFRTLEDSLRILKEDLLHRIYRYEEYKKQQEDDFYDSLTPALQAYLSAKNNSVTGKIYKELDDASDIDKYERYSHFDDALINHYRKHFKTLKRAFDIEIKKLSGDLPILSKTMEPSKKQEDTLDEISILKEQRLALDARISKLIGKL